MSSFTSASPFASALPASHVFFSYDADGDAIMTDANTGLPIVYGGAGSRRARSASLESDTESRPSKRSRSSSDEDDYADMPPLIPAVPPAAPKKAVRAPVHNPDDDSDGGASPMRNLAEQMAAAVLDGEPRDAPAAGLSNAAAVFDGPGVPPPGGEAEPDSYCVSVTVHDLALRLDMRHPRVVLNLLRFVTTYNELALPGEEIHLPLIGPMGAQDILSHESVVNPVPEFAAEVAELRALVERYRMPPQEYDEDGYLTDSTDSSDYYRRDSF